MTLISQLFYDIYDAEYAALEEERCSERHYKETDVSRETRGRLLTSRRRVQREKRRRSSRASTCRAFSA